MSCVLKRYYLNEQQERKLSNSKENPVGIKSNVVETSVFRRIVNCYLNVTELHIAVFLFP